MNKLQHKVQFSSFRSFLSFILTASLVASISLPALAEEEVAPIPFDEEGALMEPSITVPEEIPGSVSCFDYYTFGSVDVSLAPDIDRLVSGIPIPFSGSITNNNPYPLVDVSVYGKVFGFGANEEEEDVMITSAAGPDVFGMFLIQEGINLPANGTLPMSFTWDVPSNLPTGNYELATFVVSGGSFNMAGLSFTEDITANSFPFHVEGDFDSVPAFRKGETTINGERYLYTAAIPRFEPEEDVTVSHRITNPVDSKQQVSVKWTLYSWDATEDGIVSRVVDEQEEQENTFILEPGETHDLSFTTAHSAFPVYYLVAEARYRDLTSIAAVRFVRDGVQVPRLNFVGTDTFPLKKGEEATLFACMHGMGTADVLDQNELSISLTDAEGNEIHSYTYEGKVTGAVMGLADVFVPSRTADIFTITAELKHEGELVDRAELKYDCAKIDPESCTSVDSGRTLFTSIVLGFIVFFGVILLVCLIWYKRRMA